MHAADRIARKIFFRGRGEIIACGLFELFAIRQKILMI
jgi:hypothetical protein